MMKKLVKRDLWYIPFTASIITLVLASLLLFSCEEDECVEEAQIQYLSSKTSHDESLTVSEDMCIEGDLILDFLTINGDYTLYVDGDILASLTVRFNGNGSIKSTGSIIFSGSVFFLGGGNIETDEGLVITLHARDQNNLGGTIKYCNFASIGTLDPGITLTQDCENAVECQTLSDDGVGISEGDSIDLPCDFDYENQVVKTDRQGRQYIYIKQ